MSNSYAEQEIQRRGLMLVLSSPSGAGKTTISRRLLSLDSHLALSISVTTRQRRASCMARITSFMTQPNST